MTTNKKQKSADCLTHGGAASLETRADDNVRAESVTLAGSEHDAVTGTMYESSRSSHLRSSNSVLALLAFANSVVILASSSSSSSASALTGARLVHL